MLARVYLLITVVIWGWTFVASKICLQFLTPAELLSARFLMALPFMLLVAWSRRTSLRIERRHIRAVAIAAVLFIIHFLTQTMGLVHTSATNTAWLVAVSPLAMAVLAYLILRERIGGATIVGIAVATVGVLLLVSRGNLANVDWLSRVGDWLALASAFTWALYTIATRDLSRAYPPMAITVLMMIPAAFLLTGYVLMTSGLGAVARMSTEAVVALVFLGIIGMAMAHWFWLEGVARIGAARAGVFLYVEPLATTALAVPYLGEAFGWYGAAGATLVLAGVFYAARNGNRKRPPHKGPAA